MKRISVRLSAFLAVIVVVLLAGAGVAVTDRETSVVESLVMREAQTAAISGAASQGRLLDDAIDSKQLTLDEVMHPKLEEIKFDVKIEHKRYRSLLSDYTDAHGIQQIEDAVIGSCDDCLFASGMMLVKLASGASAGYVPTTNSKQDQPPKGDASDAYLSRGKMLYTGAEPVAAAGYSGAGVLIQSYPRDTGEMAWDVAAPIFVHAQHWGAFRIGVSQDRIKQHRSALIGKLTIYFGGLALLAVGAVFFVSRSLIRPLTVLTADVDRLSMAGSTSELGTKIVCKDGGEVGAQAIAVNRLRFSLHDAMRRLDAISARERPGTVIDGTGAYEVVP